MVKKLFLIVGVSALLSVMLKADLAVEWVSSEDSNVSSFSQTVASVAQKGITNFMQDRRHFKALLEYGSDCLGDAFFTDCRKDGQGEQFDRKALTKGFLAKFEAYSGSGVKKGNRELFANIMETYQPYLHHYLNDLFEQEKKTFTEKKASYDQIKMYASKAVKEKALYNNICFSVLRKLRLNRTFTGSAEEAVQNFIKRGLCSGGINKYGDFAIRFVSYDLQAEVDNKLGKEGQDIIKRMSDPQQPAYYGKYCDLIKILDVLYPEEAGVKWKKIFNGLLGISDNGSRVVEPEGNKGQNITALSVEEHEELLGFIAKLKHVDWEKDGEDFRQSLIEVYKPFEGLSERLSNLNFTVNSTDRINNRTISEHCSVAEVRNMFIHPDLKKELSEGAMDKLVETVKQDFLTGALKKTGPRYNDLANYSYICTLKVTVEKAHRENFM